MARKRRPKRLPDLPETGRLYVDRTRGGRLASHGVEQYVAPRRRWGAIAIVALIVAALTLLTYWRL